MPLLKVMNKGLTLTEIVMVVIIIGILTGLALYDYSRHIEKNKAREAEANLVVIYNAQKRYKLDNDAYFVCAPNCTSAVINENLTLNIADTYFNYSIAPYGTNDSGFIVTATRRDRDCQGKSMNITDAGGPVQKECTVW